LVCDDLHDQAEGGVPLYRLASSYMTREAGWSFVKSRTGGWMWKHSAPHNDTISRHSSRTFPTLSDCIADAKLHGYDPKAAADPARGSLLR
jgi:hypothetical protein